MKKIQIFVKNTRFDLLYQNDDSLPVVNFKLVFKAAGSINEKIAGLAKFSAKVLNEGTKKLGVSQFSRLLEIKAVEIYASSGFETFVIELNCLKEHFIFALKMLKDLLEDPNICDETVEKLKIQTYGEIQSLKNDYDYISKLELDKILHPNTALANPLIGTEKSIESINPDDVKEFIVQNLNLSNLFVVLGGDVGYEDIDFNSLLQSLQCGEKKELLYFDTKDYCKQSIINEKSEQAYVYFGAPFKVAKNERYKATTALFVLGSSGFGSRLMEEIRVKRGLAYCVYAKSDIALSHSKIWGYLQTKNESRDEAIDIVKDEFTKFTKKGINQKELDDAKKFLLGSVPLQKETMFKRLGILQNDYYNGFGFDEFDKNLKRISNLTLQEINEFIITHNEISKLSFAVLCDEIR